jgi:small nuclear ribonucleoprotein (snRNP)-like protein
MMHNVSAYMEYRVQVILVWETQVGGQLNTPAQNPNLWLEEVGHYGVKLWTLVKLGLVTHCE